MANPQSQTAVPRQSSTMRLSSTFQSKMVTHWSVAAPGSLRVGETPSRALQDSAAVSGASRARTGDLLGAISADRPFGGHIRVSRAMVAALT